MSENAKNFLHSKHERAAVQNMISSVQSDEDAKTKKRFFILHRTKNFALPVKTVPCLGQNVFDV